MGPTRECGCSNRVGGVGVVLDGDGASTIAHEKDLFVKDDVDKVGHAVDDGAGDGHHGGHLRCAGV